MNGNGQKIALWTKQCGHCFRLLGEDGHYHDMGLREPVAWLPAEPAAEGPLRVAPAICPGCFEALREGLASEEPAHPGLAVSVA